MDLYLEIAENIDRGAMGAPRTGDGFSPAFIEYLQLLYTPEEAEIVRHLKMPRQFLQAAEIAEESGRTEREVVEALEGLSRRGYVLGFGGVYALPEIPFLVNAHQFYDAVRPEDLKAAELYQQFFIRDGYYRNYESSAKGTPLTRVIPVEKSVENRQKILETEEAHEIIRAQSHLALVPCPCRTRTEKMGVRECGKNNPVGSCIMMGPVALYFQGLGLGKEVTADQAGQYLDEMQEKGLVAITDNWEAKDHTIICSCCTCCCSQVRGRTRWDNPGSLAPSNFVPEAGDACILCGACEEQCFFGALTLDEEQGRAVADPALCVGCGVCTHACPEETLKLKRIERSTPFPGPKELFRQVAAENKGAA